jgi:hypothetical protein
MQEILNKVLMTIIAIDIFALGILVLFLINFRMNIHRRLVEREFALLLLSSIQKADSTEQVAKIMNMNVDYLSQYCLDRGIETPEMRIERIQEQKRRQDEENQRIMEEEAMWRSEQEKINETRNRERELEAKKRKERLRKFGIS